MTEVALAGDRGDYGLRMDEVSVNQGLILHWQWGGGEVGVMSTWVMTLSGAEPC